MLPFWYKMFTLMLIMMMISLGYTNNSRPPRNAEIGNVADALKYLQDLDTYYSDRARVRFGKRSDPLIGIMRRVLDGDEIY